ncbi:MAG TPA: NAD(P)-dependent oxidoreductase, partial [bacterium]|nr:NAD(P)-dependent oxidoreductase [bacterium]
APLRADALAFSSYTAEHNALEMEKVGAVPVVLRFGAFYGPEERQTRRILRWAKLGFFLMAGPPEGYYPMVHLSDAAEAVLRALRAPAGVWNIVEDEPFTRRQSAEALARAMGKKSLSPPSPWMALLLRPDKAPCESLRVLNRKFKKATGWSPAFPSPWEGWTAVVLQASR